MTKTLALSLATALSAAILSVPASAQIVVTPKTAIEASVEEVSRDLDRLLAWESSYRYAYGGSGIAIVRFERDADGKPANVTLSRATGSRKLDKVAMRAVEKLDSVALFPDSLPSDQVYQANIVFAKDLHEKAALSEQLAHEEAKRLASSSAERHIIALGSVPTAKAGY